MPLCVPAGACGKHRCKLVMLIHVIKGPAFCVRINVLTQPYCYRMFRNLSWSTAFVSKLAWRFMLSWYHGKFGVVGTFLWVFPWLLPLSWVPELWWCIVVSVQAARFSQFFDLLFIGGLM